ncbi:hypothetical protein ACLOJK_027131 [Asimina triloba]
MQGEASIRTIKAQARDRAGETQLQGGREPKELPAKPQDATEEIATKRLIAILISASSSCLLLKIYLVLTGRYNIPNMAKGVVTSPMFLVVGILRVLITGQIHLERSHQQKVIKETINQAVKLLLHEIGTRVIEEGSLLMQGAKPNQPFEVAKTRPAIAGGAT